MALESEMNGVAPKLIRSTLHRKFVDLNRDKEEATFNEPIPLQVYAEYHGAIEDAVASSPLPAMLLDIHGYSDTTGNPPVTWVMLGKLLHPSTSKFLQVYAEYHGAISEAVASSPLPAMLLDIHGYSDTTGNPPVTWVMFGK